MTGSMRGKWPRLVRGVTAIELMIVVAVIAILTAIAYPSYQAYLVRGNRSAAQQFMMNVANREEQMLLDLKSYVAVADNVAFAGAPSAGGLNVSIPAEITNLYTFSVFVDNAATPLIYRIKADPVSGKMQANDHPLYLNSAGQKWRDFDGNTTFDTADKDWNAK